MSQKINHYSVIETFYRIGIDKGFFPIKEYALSNILSKLTDKRIDLVWINLTTKDIEYAFEFETSKISVKNSKHKLWEINLNTKQYIFEIKNALEHEEINLLYTNDKSAFDFLENLENNYPKLIISIHTKPLIQIKQEKQENATPNLS